MPLLDKRTGDVVLRIVYDGAPSAGKTTNLLQLCERISLKRRGALVSPGTSGTRTMFFDWLDVQGGYVGGRRLRCQLLTVPGQAVLLRRRRYLLETADAVVFVADSSETALSDNRHMLEQLRAALASARGNDDQPAVGMVLQANKQDMPGALPPDELLEKLHLPPRLHSIAAQANQGVGVLETFTLGVRIAVDRVRGLVASGQLASEVADGASDALFAALSELDALEPEPAPPEPAALAPDDPALDDILEVEEVVEPAPVREVVTRLPPLPRPDVAAGMVWPPVRGRITLVDLADVALAGRAAARAWAPSRALEADATGWVLHTRQEWSFADVDAGRLGLMNMARAQVALGPLALPDRVFALGTDAGRWRLWMFTPRVTTLEERLRAAAGAAAIAPVIVEAAGALHRLAELRASRRVAWPASLGVLTVANAAPYYLAVDRAADSLPVETAAAELLRAEVARILGAAALTSDELRAELKRTLATQSLPDATRAAVRALVPAR